LAEVGWGSPAILVLVRKYMGLKLATLVKLGGGLLAVLVPDTRSGDRFAVTWVVLRSWEVYAEGEAL
jgi:hypothetical protein